MRLWEILLKIIKIWHHYHQFVIHATGTSSTCRGLSWSRRCWTSEAAWSLRSDCWAPALTLRSWAPKEWPWGDWPVWRRAATTRTRQPSPPTTAAASASCPGSRRGRWRATRWSGSSALRQWTSASAPLKGKVKPWWQYAKFYIYITF